MGRTFKCKKCKKHFINKKELEEHHKQVHQTRMAYKELKLLKDGFVPDKTKTGHDFKGKNKIIIA
jgi:hypothetical protein